MLDPVRTQFRRLVDLDPWSESADRAALVPPPRDEGQPYGPHSEAVRRFLDRIRALDGLEVGHVLGARRKRGAALTIEDIEQALLRDDRLPETLAALYDAYAVVYDFHVGPTLPFDRTTESLLVRPAQERAVALVLEDLLEPALVARTVDVWSVVDAVPPDFYGPRTPEVEVVLGRIQSSSEDALAEVGDRFWEGSEDGTWQTYDLAKYDAESPAGEAFARLLVVARREANGWWADLEATIESILGTRPFGRPEARRKIREALVAGVGSVALADGLTAEVRTALGRGLKVLGVG